MNHQHRALEVEFIFLDIDNFFSGLVHVRQALCPLCHHCDRGCSAVQGEGEHRVTSQLKSWDSTCSEWELHFWRDRARCHKSRPVILLRWDVSNRDSSIHFTFRLVCLQRLELLELRDRRDEGPSAGLAKGDHHQRGTCDHLLCSRQRCLLHHSQCAWGLGIRGGGCGECCFFLWSYFVNQLFECCNLSPSLLPDFCGKVVRAVCFSHSSRCSSLHFWRSERNSAGLVKVGSKQWINFEWRFRVQICTKYCLPCHDSL